MKMYEYQDDCFITIDRVADNIGAYFSDIEAFNSFVAAPFLAIELPCGCKKEYRGQQDVPAENMKCEHNNYFIKIGK